MPSLQQLTDKQNLLLSQLSYESDVLKDNYNGMTLEEIMQVVPNESTKQKLKELCDAGLSSLRIKDVGNDPSSGFGAIAFTDEYGNTGFSFRGTDGLSTDSINDWVDNAVAAATGTSVQTGQAEEFFDANRDPNGNNYLYGHSKGGELAESVYVNNHSKIKEIHLLNPQPLNPYTLSPDQRIALESDKVDIVIVEGDYVWFLGQLPSYTRIRIAKSNGGNSHLYNSVEFDNSGNIISGNQPWWEYAAYFAINVVTTPIQLMGAGIGFIYNCTVRVVDFVKNDLIPAAREFIREIGRRFADLAEGLNSFFSSIIDRATNWFNNNFNAGYQYATNNPYIKLNTANLRGYANRLCDVNRRIANLDRRMDGLYTRVGFLDLWNLLQADLLTGYSWRLSRCADYLYSTADDFENLESLLYNQI